MNKAARINRPVIIKITPRNLEKTLKTAIIKSPNELPIFTAPVFTLFPILS